MDVYQPGQHTKAQPLKEGRTKTNGRKPAPTQPRPPKPEGMKPKW